MGLLDRELGKYRKSGEQSGRAWAGDLPRACWEQGWVGTGGCAGGSQQDRTALLGPVRDKELGSGLGWRTCSALGGRGWRLPVVLCGGEGHVDGACVPSASSKPGPPRALLCGGLCFLALPPASFPLDLSVFICCCASFRVSLASLGTPLIPKSRSPNSEPSDHHPEATVGESHA